MSSFFFFVQDQPKSEGLNHQVQLDLHEKLKEVSWQIKRDGVSIPDVLRSLTKDTVTQCVIGPSHIAFLLQDGRVCRVTYSIQGEKVSTKADKKRKQASSRADSPTTSRDGLSGRNGNTQQYGSRSYRSSLSAISRASRGLNFLREMQRQGIYVARSVAHQIHASEVPENLIEECQTVLQGKSRQVIIRELQNTNLDVNMAVNNLLSRDDEVEQGSGGNYGDGGLGGSGPGSDDWDDETVELLSFFEYPDSHILFESDCAMTDELIEPPTSPRLRSDSDHGYLSDRRKRRRMESHLLNRNTDTCTGRSGGTSDLPASRSSNSDSLLNLGSLLDSSAAVADGTKQSTTTSGVSRQYVQLGDILEFWSDPENNDVHLRFVHIIALHSELVALTDWGELHQWRWSDRIPFYVPASSQPSNLKDINERRVSSEFEPTISSDSSVGPLYHPRVVELGLLNEKIIKLSGCATRATVHTASGKFATWMDESLIQSLPSAYQSGSPPGPLSIEHRAMWFQELKDETIVELQTTPLITTVRCISGAIYWWGIHPSYIRQRTIERSRQHRLSSFSSRRSNHNSKSSSERASVNLRTGSDSANGNTERSLPNWSDLSNSQTTITPGSFVCIKSSPIFHAGAIGFTVINGVPKVGTLLEDAWKITDVCRFRIHSAPSTSFGSTNNDGSLHATAPNNDVTQHSLTCPHALAFASNTSIPVSFNQSGASQYCSNEQSAYSICSGGASSSLTFQEMPPPPSPASSTCSDQSGPVRVSPGTFKRMKVPSISGERVDRLVSEWDIGSQPTGRSSRGRSADRETGSSNNASVSITIGSKRSYSEVVQDSLESKLDGVSNRFVSANEEDWCLNDVVFVEDGRTQPVGIVLKVDGNIAAVKFLKEQERICLAANCAYSPVCNLINNILGSSSNQNIAGSNNGTNPLFGTTADPMSWLNDCRLLRKEDLTVVRSAGSVRVPDVVQRTPKRIFSFIGCGTSRTPNFSEGKSNKLKPIGRFSRIIAMATENCRIHVIVEENEQHPAIYQVYNLSGKLITNVRLPVLPAALCSSTDVDGSCPSPKLTCPSEPPLLLQDSAGLVFPFVPPNRTNNHEAWIMPPTIDLPPINCAAFSWFRNNFNTPLQTGGNSGRHLKSRTYQQPKSLLGVIVVKDLSLMPHILRSNDSQIERLLTSESEISEARSIKLSREMVDGQRNLLHMAVIMCAPQSNKETSPEWSAKLDPILVSPVLSPRITNSTQSSQRTNEFSITNPVSTPTTVQSSTYWSYAPPATKEPPSLTMHDLFIRSSMDTANSISSNFGRAEDLRAASQTSGSCINFWHLPPVRKDDLTRRVASYNIVRLIVESPHLSPHLPHLLNGRTTENLTPFMLAVKYRVYNVARFLYETIQCFAKLLMDEASQSDFLRSVTDYYNLSPTSRLDFFNPLASRPDDSPLFQLCYNDTCSFTWTGPDHIRQDIFECRTCGLMDSLCCCTECARVCHKGHDCRLKRTSPTAYCDCWEKCTCQSLVAGSQGPRHQIFYRLLRETNLIHTRNSRGEHLLLYLAKCVERQFREQRQHKPPRRRLNNLPTRSTSSTITPVTAASSVVTSADVPSSQSTTPEEPYHDLDPPRFARDAFELTLDCPVAVCSLLNMDATPTIPSSLPDNRKTCPFEEELALMSSQGATNHLDDFVFTLVCKCPSELIDILLNTLNRCLSSEIPKSDCSLNRQSLLPQLSSLEPASEPTLKEVKLAAARFVRSTARLYTSLFLELSPDYKKSRLLGVQPSPVDICRHILSSLASIAILELPPLAAGLLTPIRMGTLRPCVPYKLVSQCSDAVLGLEQLINSERASLTRQQLLASVDLLQPMTNEVVNISSLRGFSGTDNRSKRGVPERTNNYIDGQTTSSENFSTTTSESAVTTLPVESHINSNPDSTDVTLEQQRETPFEHETHSDIVTNAPSPFETSSIHNPSLLTLQMQSTISDIETGIPESRTNNQNVENRNFDVSFSYSHPEHPIGSEDAEDHVTTPASFERISLPSYCVNREAGVSDDEDTAECRATPNTLSHMNTASESALRPRTNETNELTHEQVNPTIEDPVTADEEPHSNIDPFSSLDRDASDGQASDYDEYDDLNDVEEHDDEDDENDTDDDDGEQDGYAIEEELVDGEDDDDDEDEDDSSHQSDASSVDAGSRSTSPTWVPCPRTSVFSRLSSRNTISYSRSTTESTVTSSNPTVTSTANRNNSDEINPSPNNQASSGTISTATSRGGHNLNLGRRAVQSVINLLSTPAPITTSSNSVVNANESGTAASASSDANMRSVSVSNQQGSASVLTTQIYLCRAFGCLLRTTADLMQEIREDMICFGSSLKRSTSVPAGMFSPVSIYDQQRRLPIYATSSSPTSNTPNHAMSSAPNLLLPSMSTNSLLSTTHLSDYRSAQWPQRVCSNLTRPSTASTHSIINQMYSVSQDTSQTKLAEMCACIGISLIPVWQWLASTMDNLEAQLRYTSAWDVCVSQRNTSRSQSESGDTNNASNREQPSNANESNPRRGYSMTSSISRRPGSAVAPNSSASRISGSETSSEIPTDAHLNVLGQRQDFLAYLFSLMRASGNDHGDSVPSIDIPSYKPIAYVLDALLYFFRIYESVWPSGLTHFLNATTLAKATCTKPVDDNHEYSILQKSPVISTVDSDPSEQCSSQKNESSVPKQHIPRTAQRSDSYFRRSESILSLSGVGRDLIETPIAESLPLAMRPQLLHPDARRTELFGFSRYFGDGIASQSLQNSLPNDQVPIHINASFSTWGERMCDGRSFGQVEQSTEHDRVKNRSHRELASGGTFLDSIAHSATLLSRWCLSLEFFGNHFTNDVGAEYGSYILELGGFSVKEARFRKQMEMLRNASRRDINLEVERDRNQLLIATVNQLNAEYALRVSHPSSSSVTTPTSIARLSSGYSYFGDQQRDTNANRSNNSPVAVALLLGTMSESPFLGTLFGSSPVTSTSHSSLGKTSLNQSPVLTCRGLKVKFKGEPGEGTGVARSFFTAFSEAVLSSETLPELNLFIQPSSTSANLNSINPHFHQHYTASTRPPGSSSLTRSTLTPCSTSLFIPSSSNPPTTQISVASVTRNIQPTSSSNTSPISISYAHHYRLQPLGSCARARTSAWRRAGRLSVSAAPFCPTSSPPHAVSRSPIQSSCRTSSNPLQSYSVTTSLVPRTAETYPTTDNPTTESNTKLNDESSNGSGGSTGYTPTSDSYTVRPLLNQILSNSSLQSVGNQLYNRVHSLVRTEQLVARITGMLLELPSSERSVLLLNDEALQNRVDEARALLTMADSNDEQNVDEQMRYPTTTIRSQPILERLVTWRGIPSDSPNLSSESTAIPTPGKHAGEGSNNFTPSLPEDPERVPLFWQPGLQGYYFPRAVPGLNTTPAGSIDFTKLAARYSIYRCIGRVIGLCLLTNETCPLNLSRPVLKYILGRVLHWHDFAFYDPTTFEGLRQLLMHTSPNSNLTGTIDDYNLTFSLVVCSEEGGLIRNSKTSRQAAISTHTLIPNGDNIDVTEANVYEFVKRYTEFKMLECVRDSLENLRQGVFDVLPRKALDGLTAEDLRLLLNGAGEIDIDILASYTTFTDESGITSVNLADNGAVARLKKWFWNTLRALDSRQRMDLLHFWTSSPTLPASAQGFQPKPSITIRPPDNNYLPTANTCISRLYLPLYSSKQILREKLLQAISTKSFGFV